MWMGDILLTLMILRFVLGLMNRMSKNCSRAMAWPSEYIQVNGVDEIITPRFKILYCQLKNKGFGPCTYMEPTRR